jgi:hypothetical protein
MPDDVLTGNKIQVVMVWVVIRCSGMMLVSCHITTLSRNPEDQNLK